MSKLSSLAQKRKATSNESTSISTTNSSLKSLSLLDKLQQPKKTSQGSTKSALSSLSSLKSKNTAEADSSDTSSSSSPSSGASSASSSSTLLQKLAQKKSVTKSSLSSLSSLSKKNVSPSLPKIQKPIDLKIKSSLKKNSEKENIVQEIIPLIDYTPPKIYHSNYVSTASILNELIYSPNTYTDTNRSKYNMEIRSNFLYPLENVSKVAKAFSESSPDDVVLQAQSQAKGFGSLNPDATAKAMALLKLKEKTGKFVPKLNVLDEIAKQKDTKEIHCFVVIGHVDAGKSTLMGRLLYESGNVSKHLIEKYEQASKNIGKQSFAFAWVMDKTDDERNRGITVNVCSTNFETSKRKYTILDAPGHRDFVPNMIEGSSRADMALLVVDSSPNAFESGFFSDGQTKEHAIVARSLGIDTIIVAVNKMDVLNWNQTRFEVIEEQLGEFLLKLGFKKENIVFVPCSGLTGENLVTRSNLAELSWYKGDSLLNTIEEQKPVERDYTRPFRLRVLEVDVIPHTQQVVVSGRIDSGVIQQEQPVVVVPSGIETNIKSIKSLNENTQINSTGNSSLSTTANNSSTDLTASRSSSTASLAQMAGTIPWAKAGDYVELGLTGVSAEDLHRGDFICAPDCPVSQAHKFVVKLTIFDTEKPILKGTQLIIHAAGYQGQVKVSKLISVFEKTAESVKTKKSPRMLKGGQSGQVELTVMSSDSSDAGDNEEGGNNGARSNGIPLETYTENKDLGRIILRREGTTLAVGIVEKIIN